MLEISSRIEELLGLHFPKNRWADLERGIIASGKELNLDASIEAMAIWLENDVFTPEQLDVLANNLTVGETYFFRDKPVLDIFKSKIIPELLAERFGKNQSLSFWSAGCCTGEEPYTIAMLLCEIVPELQNWHISILATDINPRFLEKAKAGIYGNWSFRETPENLKSKYFQRIGNQWQISDEIRSMVVFKQLNLVEDTYPSVHNFTLNIDVVFCRNVLMYFTNDLISLVGHRFFDALNPQGWLITSAVELNDELFPRFTKMSFDNSILYRKTHQGKLLSKPEIPLEKPVSPLRRLHVQPKKEVKPVRDSLNNHVHHRPIGQAPDISPIEMATRLFRKGSYSECVIFCQSAMLQVRNHPLLMLYLAKSYANIGKHDEALITCDQLLKLDALNSEAYFIKANILIEKQQLDLAVLALQRGLYIDHDHLMSHFLMSNVMRRMSNMSGYAVHLKNVKRILSGLDDNHVLDEVDGLTAGRVREMVNSL